MCVSSHMLYKYASVYELPEARGYPSILTYQYLPYSFESGFLTELYQQGPSTPCLCSTQHQGYMQTCGHTWLFTWVLSYNLMPSSYCSKYCYTLSHLSGPLNSKSAFLLDRSVHQQTKYSLIILYLFAKQSEAVSARALLPLILFFQTLGIFSLCLKPKYRFAVTLLLHNLDIYNLNWPNEQVKSKTPDIPEWNGLSLLNWIKLCSLSFYKQKQQ